MDDRRFDQLVKAVASGASRRTVLKGMLGLGGAALVGSAALDADVDAARRPTPTPKPPSCPGQQTPVGGQCVCQAPKAAGPYKCGPDCCTGQATDPYPRPAGHSECCDNACCGGTCYGEELCCPTNPSGSQGELPPRADFCVGTGECCLAPDFCCTIDGCCSTVCWGGSFDDDFCCLDDAYCPGGETSADLCCTDNTTCCGTGTDDNVCVDLSNGGCCAASDCGPPAEGTCGWDCRAGQCVSFICVGGSICCQGACLSADDYEACPTDPNECCARGTDVCCGGACCAQGRCNAAQQCCTSSQFLCGVNCCETSPGATCCGGNTCCLKEQCAGGVTCCTGSDVACGDVCCATGQCNDDPFCCPSNTTVCGEGCCDNGTETCNVFAGNVCECVSGTILCGGVCTTDECCVGDPESCQEIYGYDLNCVYCPAGSCDTAPFTGAMCDTDDTGDLGKCADGFCIPCGGGASAPCEFDEDCCSGTCQSNGQCTDP